MAGPVRPGGDVAHELDVNEAIRRLILRNADQQRAAVQLGDYHLADLFADVTTWLLDQYIHGARFWRTEKGAASDAAARQQRVAEAIERSQAPELRPTPYWSTE